jgi:hypothetical protein
MADRKKIDPRRPIPSSGYDRLRQNLSSNFKPGFPVENFPNPDNRASINRGRLTTRKDDIIKDASIGLQDHDEAIMFYFNKFMELQKDGNLFKKMVFIEIKKEKYKFLLLCLKEIVLKKEEILVIN